MILDLPQNATVGGYTEYRPPESLATCLEAIWMHAIPAQARIDENTHHRLIPDPGISLAFTRQLGKRGWHREELTLIGPIATPSMFSLVPGHEMIAIRFKLEWAAMLTHVSPADVWNMGLDYLGALPRLATPVFEQLCKTENALQAAHILSHWAEERLKQEQARNHRSWALAGSALENLRLADGAVRLNRLSDELCLTSRHLRRIFRDHFAASPKFLMRLLRLNNLIAEADKHPRPNWADLAYAHHYADQAHLIRDCRAITGTSPGILHRERKSESALFNPAC